jgi:hypothetical protein
MDASGATDESVILRTAKSCGPDASMVGVKLADLSAGDGDNKARSPGRVRGRPLKPLRAGMPGDPGATVVTNACVLLLYTRGCGCDGHPAFPAPFTGERYMYNSGAISAAGMRWRGCELKQRHSRFDATFRPGIPDRHTGYPLTPRSSMVPREFVRCEPDNSLISKVWVRSP